MEKSSKYNIQLESHLISNKSNSNFNHQPNIKMENMRGGNIKNNDVKRLYKIMSRLVGN